ncbi:MAG: hypothetical protein ACXAEF_07720 [Candidatus Thorarchaeota archaeon]
MVDLRQARRLRREAFKDKIALTIADPLDDELLEDLLIAAPEIADLQFDVLEDDIFDTRLLSGLDDIFRLKILEGPNLKEINLSGLADLKYLQFFELNVSPDESLAEIDMTSLAGHEEIKVITIACPTRVLKLEGLNRCPQLTGMGFYTLDFETLDLSPLSETKELESIFICDFGREIDGPQKFEIIPPKNVPLKLLNIQDAVNEKLELVIDWSFLDSREAMDEITIKNCSINTFDLTNLTALERLGNLDLTDNSIEQLNITPIITMPMFTEKALGRVPMALDDSVTLQIDKTREQDIEKILELPDVILDYHDGHYAIEYEFGHQWLRKLMQEHKVEWI